MQLLKYILETQGGDTTSSGATNALTPAGVDELEKLIRDGVKPDKETGQIQQWSNALELVHKAYQVGGVQRPTPDMREAWKQYEKLIAYAVEQLARTRGINGDWRMSASVFHESLKSQNEYLVEATGEENHVYTVNAKSVEEIIKSIENMASDYQIKIIKEGDTHVVSFWKHGVKSNYVITIHS